MNPKQCVDNRVLLLVHTWIAQNTTPESRHSVVALKSIAIHVLARTHSFFFKLQIP